ncbi:hypothetical protein QNI19_36745 [Cytophagaceae bacterium DM2B3-1]|uniref:STAS domain-containing protein n=1 Tax=Xanthocytophaga flava TaxID=3048013 RepID=A0ABT7CXP1_9BACT|nr:hypothetical protein [Xanthocytophaga flavus]MDJ1498543.1 hypothetical protein [Xanthocytophaga flavus]
MKKKRLQHQANVICEMFCGWRLEEDCQILLELGKGKLDCDILSQKAFCDGVASELQIVKAIYQWLQADWLQNGFDQQLIQEVRLAVDFQGAKQQNIYKQEVVHFIINCKSEIRLNDHVYIAFLSKDFDRVLPALVSRSFTSAIQCTRKTKQVGVDPTLYICFTGIYRPGSAGNEDAEYMMHQINHCIDSEHPQFIIVDLRELVYTWGNAITQAFRIRSLKQQPFVVLISEKSQALDSDFIKELAGCSFYLDEQTALDVLK